MALMESMMLDIFKDETGGWLSSRTILYSDFRVSYYVLAGSINLRFMDIDGEEFAFILAANSAGMICWTADIEPPTLATSYPKLFDFMVNNMPSAAEWLLWNMV